MDGAIALGRSLNNVDFNYI
nr:hypothetical protein [Ruminiclostridium herbifermentans]